MNTKSYDQISVFNISIKKKIIGITCHNSKSLAKTAIKNKVDYLAFGSFNRSKLKPYAKKANLNILKWAKRNI